jgi:hypothetical protein
VTLVGSMKNSDNQMNGIGPSRDEQWALLNMKMDVGFGDSNCLASSTYQSGTFGVLWSRDILWKTERHSDIRTTDIIPNGIVSSINVLTDPTH